MTNVSTPNGSLSLATDCRLVEGLRPASIGIYERAAKVSDLLVKATAIILGACIALSTVAPCIIALVDFMRGKYSSESWILPIKIKLPWMDVWKPPGYQIGYFLEVVLAAAIGLVWTTVDPLFCGVCLFIAAYLKDLHSLIAAIGQQ